MTTHPFLACTCVPPGHRSANCPGPARPAAAAPYVGGTLTTSIFGKSRNTLNPTPKDTTRNRQRQREIHFSFTFHPPRLAPTPIQLKAAIGSARLRAIVIAADQLNTVRPFLKKNPALIITSEAISRGLSLPDNFVATVELPMKSRSSGSEIAKPGGGCFA